MDDTLQRFLDAQKYDYGTALCEMQEGRKRSHWIWYVFPQVKGLGRSWESQYYGIADLAAARACLAHPVLGKRLREATRAVLAHSGESIDSIMGSGTDTMKFRSSMTLFEAASGKAEEDEVFAKALDTFYGGNRDRRTLRILGLDIS